MNRPTTDLMAFWITEREQMRLRKDLGPPDRTYGYSDNAHMGLVRYCNVRREDDKVTRWLAANWRPTHHAPWEVVLARMVNYIPTLEELQCAVVWDGGLPSVAHYMKERRRRGDKVWTSAYTISTCGKSMDKVDYMLGVVDAVRDSWKEPLITHLSDWHRALMRTDGLGSFLAAQVVADLKNTAGHPLQNAPDWHTWSAPGPGSLKGLCEYFGSHRTPRTYQADIEKCWGEVQPLLPEHLQDLHMQDFQNCLCEFSKFMRVRRGGHVRNKYSAG